MSKRTMWVLWGVLIFSLAIRIVDLGSVPANINPDEADTLQTYLLAKYTGVPSFFGVNWNGAPATNTYIIGWSWEVFGRSVFGIRIFTAVITSISIALFFLLACKLTRSTAVSVVVSVLLATNPWFLNFSRSGWENAWNGLTIVLAALAFYYLFVDKRQNVALVLLAISSVLSFYFYHPGKILFVVMFLFLLLAQCWSVYRIPVKKVVSVFVFVVLLTLPQAIPLLDGQSHAWHRIKSVSILNLPKDEIKMSEQVTKNTLGFLFFSRTEFDAPLNSRYITQDNNPILPLLTIFYWVGLGISLFAYPYYVGFYFLVLFPVQLLSIGTPDAARSVHLVPLIFLFMAIALNVVFREASKHGETLYKIVRILIIVLLSVTAINQYASYQHWIRASTTLQAREPAISLTEYPIWLSRLEEEIRISGRGFTVGQWKVIRDQTDPR